MGAHDLVHRDGHAPVAGVREPARLDARVDLLELPAPVVAHVVAAADTAALERIGPVDVRMQDGEDGVDVPCVERAIDVAQQRFCSPE